MLWLQLFESFVIIGFASFGGGYAMIPLMEHEVVRHGWMSVQSFTHAVSIAGMSPGPVGTNCAIFIGYQTAGWPGAILATAGMVLPSFLIVVAASVFFYKFYSNRWVKAAFYGLRPVIVGLIFYGAIRFAVGNGLIGPMSYHTAIDIAIFAFALFALWRYRLHPLSVILLSGLLGAAIYG